MPPRFMPHSRLPFRPLHIRWSPVKIDAHQHFWKYDAIEYDWNDDEMKSIRRDFLPPNLKKELDAAGIDASIAVQARQTVAETEWLLALAETYPYLAAVAGWVPLIDPKLHQLLDRLVTHKKLRAVRHVLQGEKDERYMLRPDFQQGIRILSHYNLVYEILIYSRQLPQTIEFVDAHPNQRFVLDHIAKPPIKAGPMEPWAINLKNLAQRPNVVCKVSGVVTEAVYNGWTRSLILPYLDVTLEAFGPHRLMFGSDWPVCLVATTYHNWHTLVQEWASALSVAEQKQLFGLTAVEAYGLAQR
jgi:L-fuconolactonase